MRIPTAAAAAMLLLASISVAQDQPKKNAKKAAAPALPAGVTLHKDIVYATVGDTKLELDLYMPAATPGPGSKKPGLIVWIHGGSWSKGSKDKTPITWLSGEGYAIASLNYRLTGVAPFPALLHDCKGAIRFLRAHAAEYGYDATRVGVAGSSAGGHIAGLVGSSGNAPQLEGDVGGNTDRSSAVQAVMDFFGPNDTYYNATVEKDRVDVEGGPLWMLLGGKPSENTDKARTASVLNWLDKSDPPYLIMHGTADPQVKPLQSERLHAACQAAGIRSQLVIIPGAGHGGKEFFDDPEKRAMIKAFLDANLKP